ncbi:MAG: hypothetical protein AB1782_02735 [Cyanobacteriota bacterium]
MTSIGLNWNYGYQNNISSNGLTYQQNSFNDYFINSQQQYLTGQGDPLAALNHGLGLIDQWSQPQNTFSQPQYNYNYNYNPGMGYNNSFQMPQAPAGLEGVMASAAAETMMMMGMQMAIQAQLQGGMQFNPNDPLAMNKMMGAQMEQIGGDLKDDGIINGSNKKQNPMQKLMQMMMMFMQMIMAFLGLNQQQQQPMPQNQQQYVNPNDPMAMNKMMGARMERIGGDLKDDGIINGSNKPKPHRPPHPMQLMQGLMMMFAGMDTIDNGQLDGSIFRQYLQA